MKKVLFILVFTFLVVFLAGAQGPPPPPTGGGDYAAVGIRGGDATAHIIQPIEINKITDLRFGNIAAGTAAGAVVISTTGDRSSLGNVTLIDAGDNSSAAKFDITGHPDATFTISLPLSIRIATGIYEMEVIDFESSLGDSSILNAQGEASLKVGATLNVEANQEPGFYTGSFDVTISYN